MGKSLEKAIMDAETTLGNVRDNVKDIYPDITLEDVQRIRDGLIAVTTAPTLEELNRRGKEYRALHAELRKKYRSGKR